MLNGILLGCLVELYNTDAEDVKITTGAIILVLISAIFQAGQHVIEEKILKTDDKLTLIQLIGNLAIIKVVILLASIPILLMIPCPEGICDQGKFITFGRAI